MSVSKAPEFAQVMVVFADHKNTNLLRVLGPFLFSSYTPSQRLSTYLKPGILSFLVVRMKWNKQLVLCLSPQTAIFYLSAFQILRFLLCKPCFINPRGRFTVKLIKLKFRDPSHDLGRGPVRGTYASTAKWLKIIHQRIQPSWIRR